MALIPPHYLDCVVAIGFGAENEKRRYVGTGFLYGHPVGRADGEPQTYNIFLVTNKHVFGVESAAWVRFNPEAAEPAQEFPLWLRDDKGNHFWFTDPDKDVDLAVVPINGNMLTERGIKFAFFRGDRDVLRCDDARKAGVNEGDGVFALGFPMGLIGARNFVIVRQGAIARISDALMGASDEILIDISIFPGNSGGPVVTRPEVVAIEGTQALNHALLLGVVASYVPYQDIAVSAQTGRTRVVFEENSGLASIIPVDHVTRIVSDVFAKLQGGAEHDEDKNSSGDPIESGPPNQALEPTAFPPIAQNTTRSRRGSAPGR